MADAAKENIPSLYIHIPFCERKCFYCSFVVAIGQEHRFDTYLDCLELEMQRYRGSKISSIYFGGGTPTLLATPQLERLLNMVQTNFSINPSSEMTIEANPEGLTSFKARILKQRVSRVSLGAQSFNNDYLKYLGRCHDQAKIYEAFTILREAGFDNISLDLMFSFPGQTSEEIRRDVQAMTALNSEHISLYSLTVEPSSRFFVKKIAELDKEIQGDHYALVMDLLEGSGYEQYEISNFARQGKRSEHNLNYWQGGDYIGLGVGAHGHKNGVRQWNVSRLAEYLDRLQKRGDPVEGREILNPTQRFYESLLFGLRMNEGVNLQQLQEKFDYIFPSEKQKQIDRFVQSGWLHREGERLGTTKMGRLILDELAVHLIEK